MYMETTRGRVRDGESSAAKEAVPEDVTQEIGTHRANLHNLSVCMYVQCKLKHTPLPIPKKPINKEHCM